MHSQTDDINDSTQSLLPNAPASDVGFSISQIPNAVYYNAYLRYWLAWVFVVGKIIQAAGQNVLGLTTLLATKTNIEPSLAAVIVAALTIINISVNSATRITPTRKGFELNNIYLVTTLDDAKADKIPEGSYLLSLNNTSTTEGEEALESRFLYKLTGKKLIESVALTENGQQKLAAFQRQLNTHFQGSCFSEGETERKITDQLSPNELAMFSTVLAELQNPEPYLTNTAYGLFTVCYSFCCLSMFFSALSAYLSGVTLIENFIPAVSEQDQVYVGLYVLSCATISYYFFNLAKMYTNVDVFCQSIDNGLSSDFDLIEIVPTEAMPTKVATGKLYLRINPALDNIEASLDYVSYGMTEWRNITQTELNLASTIKQWDFGSFNSTDTEQLKLIKARLAEILVARGDNPYKGFGINPIAMTLTVLASVFGTVASCGMADLMMVHGEEKIPILKDFSAKVKESFVLTNVEVSVFPSTFNFSASCYGLFDKLFPQKKWRIPQFNSGERTVADDKVNTPASTPYALAGVFMGLFILIDSTSNSVGSLVGMMMLVKEYFNPKGETQKGLSDALVWASFIDNICMNFSFGLSGSSKTITALNQLSCGLMITTLIEALKSLCCNSAYSKVLESEVDLEAQQQGTPIRFTVAACSGSDIRKGRNSHVNEVSEEGFISMSPSGEMRTIKSQGELYITATPQSRKVTVTRDQGKICHTYDVQESVKRINTTNYLD